MRKVKFIKDFATKKKGEAWECDSMLARSLVDKKVAKYHTEKKKNEKS